MEQFNNREKCLQRQKTNIIFNHVNLKMWITELPPLLDLHIACRQWMFSSPCGRKGRRD